MIVIFGRSPTSYQFIAPLLGKRVRPEIILKQWGKVLSLDMSIKAGHVSPSVMLTKIAAYERQYQLVIAMQEIGKIKRSIEVRALSCADAAMPRSTTARAAPSADPDELHLPAR